MLTNNNMETLLLLGGYGFIGTNILKYIDANCLGDYKVVVFDRYPKHLDNIQFECVVNTYAGDFSDEYLLERVFYENNIDIVIHSLSASVPSLSKDNSFDLQFNVMPTICLLDIMTKHSVDKMVFISSGGAIYGDHYVDISGHKEDEVLFPKSAYGVSKLVIEKYLYLYHVQYGIKSLVLRLSNPYGPYHYSQKQGVINIALEKALKGELFEIWGDGEGKKDYIYIMDFCDILVKLLMKNWQDYQVLNIGSGEMLSVNQIVENIKKICPTFVVGYRESNVLDVKDFRLNLNKLNNVDVCPTFTSIVDGLNMLKDWYLYRNSVCSKSLLSTNKSI